MITITPWKKAKLSINFMDTQPRFVQKINEASTFHFSEETLSDLTLLIFRNNTSPEKEIHVMSAKEKMHLLKKATNQTIFGQHL